MRHGEVFEGKIAVIDLDSSHLSTTLIEKLNTSAYVEITEVYHSPVSVRDLTAHDKNIGVLYFPKGLEKELKRRDRTFNIGYFADYSNLGQNGQAIANLSEIIATLGAENSAPEAAALAKASTEKVQALLQPMDIGKTRTVQSYNLSFNYLLQCFYLLFLIHYPRPYLGNVSR